MAEMWHYTSEGKQMDAIPFTELKRLVGDGRLKPTDMVWQEGMPRWVRASSLKELFPEPGAALDKYFTPGDPAKKMAPVSVPEATGKKAEEKRSRRSPDDEDDRRRPPRRRSEVPSGGGSNVFLMLALVVGGGVLLFALVGGIVILLVAFSPRDNKGPGIVEIKKDIKEPIKDAPAPPPAQEIKGSASYNAAVPANGNAIRSYLFRKGASYEIRVRSQPRGKTKPNVDLLIADRQGNVQARHSDAGPDPFISSWQPAEDGEYRIELHNRDTANVQAEVTIREGDPPPPAGVRVGSGTENSKLIRSNSPYVVKFRPKAGHAATLTATAIGAKLGDPGVSITVVRESDQTPVASTPAPGSPATVTFTLATTEVVIARFRNEGKSAVTISVIYNVSPP